MEWVRKAWSWKPPAARMKTVRVRALRIAGVFLSLMICCTVLSRAADSMTVPVVRTDKPQRAAIVHSFTADGMLEAVGGVPVMAPQSLPVLKTEVSEGDSVKAGDLLFTCDLTELNREISAKQIDIQSAQAQISVMLQNEAASEERSRSTHERAEEDYSFAQEQAELKLQAAGQQLRTARDALRSYEREYGRYDEEYSETEYDRLRAAYRAQQIAYDQAVAEQEEALIKAQRDMEDAQLPAAADASLEVRQLELRRLQLELSALYESSASGGAVYAPVDGIVTKLNVTAGSRTTSEAAAIITDTQTMRFTTQITKEQKKHVQPGDLFSLKLSGQERAMQDVAVLSATALAENPEVFEVVAELSGGAGVPGMSGEAEFSQRSETYERTIPLSALYGTEEKYFVLAVRERETALGTEYYAEQVDVSLLERNSERAAIQGGVSSQDSLIISSAKPVRNGDRIRLQA